MCKYMRGKVRNLLILQQNWHVLIGIEVWITKKEEKNAKKLRKYWQLVTICYQLKGGGYILSYPFTKKRSLKPAFLKYGSSLPRTLVIQKRRMSCDRVLVDTRPSLYCLLTCSNSIAIFPIVVSYFSIFFVLIIITYFPM